MISVYITDDHPPIIQGLQYILAGNSEVEISGMFTRGQTLLDQLEEQRPDVLLLDIHLPDISGNRLARIVSEKYPGIAILAFTNMNTGFHIQDMMNNGCKGYLLKTADKATILKAIKEVYAGRPFLDQLDPGAKNDITDTRKRLQSLPPLTKREQEVLKYICAGRTNQQIADALQVSLRTIESHRFHIQQKLRAKNMVDLIKYALHMGLTD